MVHKADRESLQGFVERTTKPSATVFTDEWRSYDRLAQTGRRHFRACHTPGQRIWAWDADGDGINEVHDNTLEGIWTGLRNFLRTFRGVSKWNLEGYVAIFQWGHNVKKATTNFIRAMLGLSQNTAWET